MQTERITKVLSEEQDVQYNQERENSWYDGTSWISGILEVL